MRSLGDLERNGTIRWRAENHAWIADPARVVQALTDEGFAEYRREIATSGRAHVTSGGMWHGLDPRTGVVAAVIWVAQATAPESHVFIEIDGRPVEGSAWSEIDAEILEALAAGGGRLTPAQIAEHVGMSEGAVQSLVSMLAEQGKVRIAAVELVERAPFVSAARVRRPR
jgi:hypothetical protein